MTTTSVQNDRTKPAITGLNQRTARLNAVFRRKTAVRSKTAEHISTVVTLIIVALFPTLALYESRPSAYDTLGHQLIGTLGIVMHLLLRVKSISNNGCDHTAREMFTDGFLFVGLGFFYPSPLVWLFLLFAWFWKRLNSTPPANGRSRPELLHLLGYSSFSNRTTRASHVDKPDLKIIVAALISASLHVAFRAAGLSSAFTAAAPLILFAWECAGGRPFRCNPIEPTGRPSEP